MKVFISWSGNKSKAVAKVFGSWIRRIISPAETWTSMDIEKGSPWMEQLREGLEQTMVGIICLDKSNLSSRWINYEAGALSNANNAYVCTFLLDIGPEDVKLPLGQFQHCSFTKDDIKLLLHSINKKVIEQGEKGPLEKDLDYNFERDWPDIEKELNKIKDHSSEKGHARRTEHELLEEIYQKLVIGQGSKQGPGTLVADDKYSSDPVFPNYEIWRNGNPDLQLVDYQSLMQKIRVWLDNTSI